MTSMTVSEYAVMPCTLPIHWSLPYTGGDWEWEGITPRVIVGTIKSLDNYNMSSILRSLQTPVGYFVMSHDTVLDGSGHGLYDISADTLFGNSGLVTTPAQFQMNTLVKNDLFDGDATGNASVTLQDLGKTVYGGQLYSSDGGTLQGVSDMRKVKVVSGSKADSDTAYYVPLGTNLRNSTGKNLVSTSIKPSVALVGKLL